MASDETMTFHSSMQDEDFDNDIDDGYDDHHHPHPHNLSRLSVCTSSTLSGVDDEDDDDVDNAMAMYVSGLTIESFEGDGDADGEFSDGKELPAGLSFDSENEMGSSYSLLATTPWRMRCRRIIKDTWVSSKDKKKDEEYMIQGFSGESDQSGGGCSTGVRVITRPKGGRRSLCMDLEEVKACRDLGFELEHERMLEMPSRISLSNSTLDTSSGGNSPIATGNWRISSPGDDPRDVKARLKVWAQVVALASAFENGP